MIQTRQFTSNIKELPNVFTFIHSSLGEHKCLDPILLAVEEVASNIIKYSYTDSFVVSVDIKPSEIIIELVDSGSYFDPTSFDINQPLPPIEKLEPGGRGILLTCKVMDEVRYFRKNNQNHLILIKHLQPRQSNQ
jgi:anti-sigma regulatory factor (Ser/Thr protein kinase)